MQKISNDIMRRGYSGYEMRYDIDDLLNELNISEEQSFYEDLYKYLSDDKKERDFYFDIDDAIVSDIADDTISNAWDSELIDELDSRGYKTLTDNEYTKIFEKLNKRSFGNIFEHVPDYLMKDVICDLLGVQHLTSKEDIKMLINKEIDKIFK